MKERFGMIQTDVNHDSDWVSFEYVYSAGHSDRIQTRSMDDLLDLQYAVKRAIRKVKEYEARR